MSNTINLSGGQPEAADRPRASRRSVLGRFAAQYSNVAVPFEVVMPDGSLQPFGQGAPSFRVTLRNQNAVRAISSIDEGRIADAYLAGDLDLDGDMLKPFELRGAMKDFHLLTEAWRFLQPLLFGQVRTNKTAITTHYDIDADFFLSFLDPVTPCYTQGVYESADETLDIATLRKFQYCFEKLKLKPGDHLLEVGPGWGAWFEYASARGVKCTGISISRVSIDYLNKRAKELGRDWELIEADLFEYESARKHLTHAGPRASAVSAFAAFAKRSRHFRPRDQRCPFGREIRRESSIAHVGRPQPYRPRRKSVGRSTFRSNRHANCADSGERNSGS